MWLIKPKHLCCRTNRKGTSKLTKFGDSEGIMIRMEARLLRSLHLLIQMTPKMKLGAGKKDFKIAISVPMSVSLISVASPFFTKADKCWWYTRMWCKSSCMNSTKSKVRVCSKLHRCPWSTTLLLKK